MENEIKKIKSKRLKWIRGLMYFDALLLMLSLMMIDVRSFSLSTHSGVCIRILILLGVFILLFFTEKNLATYLRKHRSE